MTKKKFSTPQVKVVKMQTESIICASGAVEAKGVNTEQYTIAGTSLWY